MSEKEQEKVTLRLFRGDKEKLTAMFPGIGYNKAVRHIVHNFIKGVEEKAMKRAGTSPVPMIGNVDISSIKEEADAE